MARQLHLARTLAALACATALFTAPGSWAQTKGPHGETATPSSALTLTDEEVEKVKAGKHTAALVWHMSQTFTSAVTAGATDEFKRLGIEIVATTDAGFDAAKQQSDVETALVRDPDIILTLPIDVVSAAEAFRPAVEKGTKLVILSNPPDGYVAGRDYVTVVTDDIYEMGKQTADALAKALNNKGDIAYFFHDANYYVTNQRDQAFKETIEKNYPDIKIVASQGFSDPMRVQELAEAVLTQHPDLDGVYATWAEPAEGVLAALRGAGNKTTKIATLDLSEVIALDMVQDGNVSSITVDMAYELGRAMATAGAYGILGKPAPEFVVVPAMTLDKSNVVQGYMDSMRMEAPQSVVEAAKK